MEKSLFAGILLIFFSFFSIPSFGSMIQIIKADASTDNEYLMINTEAKIILTDSIREALNSNIKLTFDLEVLVKGEKFLFWKKRLFYGSHRFELNRYALGEKFVVTEVANGKQTSYIDLETALHHLGKPHQLKIPKTKHDPAQNSHEISVRWKLSKDALPTPMALTALFSSSWNLNSPWYVLPVNH